MQLKGKGSFSGRNVIVVAYDNAVFTDEKGRVSNYLDVQINAEDLREGEVATNLHLFTTQNVSTVDGNEVVQYSNGVTYRPSQLEKIKEVAGDNMVELKSSTGEVIGGVYAVKGDLFMPDYTLKGRKFIMLNTKTLEASDFAIGEDVFAKQGAATRAASQEAVAPEAVEEAPKKRGRKPKAAK